MFPVSVALGIWGNGKPAQMVIGLPDKRDPVLERPEKGLKEICKKILALKTAAAVPKSRTAV